MKNKVKSLIAGLFIMVGVFVCFPAKEAQSQIYVSNKCCTMAGRCYMDGFAVVGSACYCPGVYGPIFGNVC